VLHPRLSLFGLALLLTGGMVSAAQNPTAARRIAVAPTPGQLQIIGANGGAVGLCPLKHTAVTADVAGFVARVNVRQEFRNPSNEPVEALYTFPLPADAAVDDMTMIIGQRVVKGQIKRREEARAIYEAAKNSGQAASLLDQERSNIFTQSVANIMPGEGVTISISYVHLLKYDEGQYEFVFPTVVGPRYVPNGGGYTTPGSRGASSPAPVILEDPGKTPVVTDADKITPPIAPPATRAGHDLSILVNLDGGLPLQDVRSQLHPIRVDRAGPSRARIQLEQQTTLPNKDFVLRYRVAGDHMQTGLVAHAPGPASGGYFTMILQPPLAPPQSEVSPKEMVFVIDQTGSQNGWPIEKAKETMRFCIENLNPGDTFQLLGFNTQVFPCFSAPVPANPANVAAALKFLAPIQGNGGTDILKAVDYALTIPDDPGRLRVVCYMTDGYVGNDMQIIDYIRKNRGRARLFPFGIGNSVNRMLIEGMATEGKGASEYVMLNAPGNAAAAKFYTRVAKPLLIDVQVDWNGLPVEHVYPKAIPDVFTAGPIILKGRYHHAAEGDITLRGTLRGRPWSQRVHVRLPALEKGGSAIPTLWARAKLEDLQVQDYLGAQTNNPNPEIQQQIIGVALDYRLMSQYTSFVAVEERVVNVGGKQRKLDVPVELPEGVSHDGMRSLRESESLGRKNLGLSAYGLNYRYKPQSGGRRLAREPAAAAQPAPLSAAGGVGGVPPPASTPQGGALGKSRGLDLRTKNLPNTGLLFRGSGLTDAADVDFFMDGEEGEKRLAQLKPAERKAVLVEAKLAPAFHGLAAKLKKDGKGGSLKAAGLPEVTNGRVDVYLWLNKLPPDGLQKLKALGFNLAATLKPGALLLGTLPVEKLEAVLELPFVRGVEPPKYR